MFDLSDRLFPGEGRSYDLTSDVDATALTVSASLVPEVGGASIGSLLVTNVDAYTWRIHIPDSMTAGLAGRRVILKVIISDPAAPTEPDIAEALLTVLPQ